MQQFEGGEVVIAASGVCVKIVVSFVSFNKSIPELCQTLQRQSIEYQLGKTKWTKPKF